MKLQKKIRDNHTMSLENKPTTYLSMMYLKSTRLKFSLFEVSQNIRKFRFCKNFAAIVRLYPPRPILGCLSDLPTLSTEPMGMRKTIRMQ